jgi:hypothetical protein
MADKQLDLLEQQLAEMEPNERLIVGPVPVLDSALDDV